jgi:hypothetical protein
MEWPTRAEIVEFLKEQCAGVLLVALLFGYAFAGKELLLLIRQIPIIGWVVTRDMEDE